MMVLERCLISPKIDRTLATVKVKQDTSKGEQSDLKVVTSLPRQATLKEKNLLPNSFLYE